ncbi:MAG: hypothetical protein COA90_08300 [Gammaproteobacteria bacterium]|nr:MAG: hypothetical protein COA90_08300 [Gammaproteobacteria bacterium]
MNTDDNIILEVDTIPKVDLDFMNNTHVEEIHMVKLLGEKIRDYQAGESLSDKKIMKLSQLLIQWLDHTHDHFQRENELMLDTHFPMYPMHSSEHTRVLEDMKQRVSAWQNTHDLDVIAEYVFSIWPHWFDGHVNSMDMMTARFAVMQGYQAA